MGTCNQVDAVGTYNWVDAGGTYNWVDAMGDMYTYIGTVCHAMGSRLPSLSKEGGTEEA